MTTAMRNYPNRFSKKITYHNCPVAGCLAQIKSTNQMCDSHWNLGPGPLKKAVLDAYRQSPGSEGHRNAIAALCRAVERVKP